MPDYSNHFSEDSLWEKIKKFAIKAGKSLIETVLTLYYCMLDEDTPLWAKATIASALGYFILPIDLIPDMLPGGYVDDAGVLATALASVAAHIKQEHKDKAQEKLQTWFG